MQGAKGASLSKTRQIYRRMSKELEDTEARLKEANARGREAPLVVESIAILKNQLAGNSAPVGVLKETWKFVCANATPAEPESTVAAE